MSFTWLFCTHRRKQYWLKENPIKQDTPDIFAYTYRDPYTKNEIGVVKEEIPLEICEYPLKQIWE